MGPKGQTSVGASMVAPCWCPSYGRGSTHGSTLVSFQWRRVHPWVPSGRHSLEHQWWLHPAVHPMEGSTHGSMLCPSNGRGCNHGSQGPSTGWSTHGSMLCPSNGRGCTHGSQGANIGWSINGGSMLVSIPWKREHPWVPRAEHRVEHLWVHAAVHPMARCTHGSIFASFQWKRMHPWVPRSKHCLEHPWWLRAGVHPMEEGAPMGPKGRAQGGAPMDPRCRPSRGLVHPWVPCQHSPAGGTARGQPIGGRL